MTRPPILLTGGTGKTGRRVAARLAERGVRARVASRGGDRVAGHEGVRFAWGAPDTYADALRGVEAVYLVAPPDATDSLGATLPFLERARAEGVRRFVLLSASSLEAGGPLTGRVHTWLKAGAPEWAVLRPTWFMQNFSEQQHLPTLRDEGKIYTATGDGRVPFIDADDIAAAAVAALVAPDAPNRDFVLTGPRALSYDDVAEIVSEVAGHRVRHVNLTEAELAERWGRQGLPQAYAAALAAMDTEVAGGSEDRLSGAVTALTGAAPRTFEAFAAANAACWVRGA